jgi:hypothetical protein
MADTSTKKEEKTIRREYIPNDVEHEVIKRVYERKQQMADKRSPFEKIWDNAFKNWEGAILDKTDWKSNIFIPLTSSVIESQLSEIIQQELMPWAIARGLEDEPKATVMNAMLAYTWDVSKSDIALIDIIKDALICGTGIGQEYYWKQPRTVKGAKKKDGSYEEHKVVEYDNCYLEPVKLEDFYIDERARGFSGPFAANDCIRRYIMDIEDFKNFFVGDWDPLGNAKYVKPGGDTNYYEYYKPPERLDHSHEVEVLWYYNRSRDELNIIANDVVVKMGPLPNKHKQLPFVRVIDVKRPYQFYGKGEAELMESLQEETNTLRRMTIDRNHMDIDKAFIVSDTFTMEDEDTGVEPHKFIQAGSDAKPLEYSDVPASVYKTLEMLRDDVIRVTGMDERQQSVSAAGTATEAAILKEATMKRINMKIWQIKNDTLVDIGRLRCANIMQYFSQPRLERIVGTAATEKAKAAGTLVNEGNETYQKKFRSIRLEGQKLDTSNGQTSLVPTKGFTFFTATPDMFMPNYGGFDIRHKATSSMPISKPLEMQKADEMYDRLIQNPTIDLWALAEYELKTRDLDADKFKKQQAPQKEGVDPQKMIDLAGAENAEMMQGKKIGPTPYASPVHTQVHIEFMKSKKFKEELPPELTDQVIKLFSDHVMGESTAQQVRGGEGEPQVPGQEGAGAGYNNPEIPTEGQNMGAMVDTVQGGGQVDNGMQGPAAGISGGSPQ